MYVWDNAIPGDANATWELIGFASERGIGTLLLESSPVGYAQPGAADAYADFVASAHAAGLEVFALAGCPWWTVPDNAGIPGQTTGHSEGWLFYRAVASSGVPFDGVVDDSEPYLANTAHWWAEAPSRAQGYLDWLHGVRNELGGLPFHATIPFWFDQDPRLTLALEGGGKLHPLNWYTSRIVDVVHVMAYRDTALGTDGILEHFAGEEATGPCILAVETSPVTPEKITFWEEGESEMELQLERVSREYRRSRTFLGFAIHDYASYRSLAP